MKIIELFILSVASVSSLFLAAAIGPKADSVLFQSIEPILGRKLSYFAVTLLDVGCIYLTMLLIFETKRSLKDLATKGGPGVVSDGP